VAVSVLLALVAAAYASALAGAGFVYDDRRLLVENPLLVRWAAGVKPPAGQPGDLRRMLGSDFARIGQREGGADDRVPIHYFRPVITLSYAADAWFWGHAAVVNDRATWQRLNPFGFHLTNLLFHAINVLLVATLVRSLGMKGRLPWITAALFAVHPVHTESVTWIAGRTDVIAATFFLAALIGYVRFRRSGSRLAYGAAVGFATVGLFAKEMTAAVIPALIVFEIVEVTVVLSREGPGLARRLLAVAPFAAGVILYFVVRARLDPAGPSAPDPWKSVPFATIVLSFLKACAWYGGKLLWPMPLDIYPMLGFASPLEGLAAGTGLAVGLGLAGWFAWKRREPAVALGVFGFFVSLAPLSCLVPGARLARTSMEIEFPVAERFLYIPSVFAVLALGWLLLAMARRLPWVRWFVVWIVVAMAWFTFERGLDYRDNVRLYARAVETAPSSVRMRTNLGLELVNAYRGEEAKRQLFESIRLREEVYGRGPHPLTYRSLAACYDLEGAYRRGLHFLERAYRQVPTPAVAAAYAFSLSVVAAMDRDLADLQKSLGLYREAVARAPGFSAARRQADAIALAIRIWKERGKDDRAVARLGRSFGYFAGICQEVSPPRLLEALHVLDTGLDALAAAGGASLGARTRARREALLDEFRSVLGRARRLYRGRLTAEPNNATLLFLAGQVERRAGFRLGDAASIRRAESYLVRALDREPGHTRAALGLASIYVGQGREREAIRRVEAAAWARARKPFPLAPEAAIDAVEVAYDAAGRSPAWRAALERTLDFVVARLETGRGGEATDSARLAAIQFRGAALLGEKRRYEAAIFADRRALERDPKLTGAAVRLVEALKRIGRTEEADSLRRKFAVRFPKVRAFRD
jgi:tetratricopeptide (TPR) repeat protein